MSSEISGLSTLGVMARDSIEVRHTLSIYCIVIKFSLKSIVLHDDPGGEEKGTDRLGRRVGVIFGIYCYSLPIA